MGGDTDYLRYVAGIGTLGASEILAEDNPFGSEKVGDWFDAGRSDRAAAAAALARGEEAWAALGPSYDSEGNMTNPGHMPGYDDLALSDKEIEGGLYSNRGQLYTNDQSTVDGLEVSRTNNGDSVANKGLRHYEDILNGSGFDATAEAEYDRRRQQAEQQRRSNTEAVSQQMELRGMGGGGLDALGALTSGQGAVTDQYAGGLAANAMRQGNMQHAAGQMVGAGQVRQGQNDGWQQWQAQEQGSRDKFNAGQYWEAAKLRGERANYVTDHNADTRLAGAMQGKGAAQQVYDNKVTQTAGMTNQLGARADQSNYDAEEGRDAHGVGVDAFSNIAGMFASG